jgi:hypothetical protein
MGILDRVFGHRESDDFGASPFARATKLTSQGNYYGKRGNLGRPIRCFKKEISIYPSLASSLS